MLDRICSLNHYSQGSYISRRYHQIVGICLIMGFCLCACEGGNNDLTMEFEDQGFNLVVFKSTPEEEVLAEVFCPQ